MTTSRKTTATEGFKRLVEKERDKLAKHMSHLKEVSEACYTAVRGTKEATEGFEIVAKLRKGDKPGPATLPETRKKFSPEETELITTYFQTHIRDRCLPRMMECQEFLDTHHVCRSSKDIYDKVRNLMK